MKTQLFNEYAALKLQITECEAKTDALKPQIIEEMAKEEADSIEHSAGLFSLQERRLWTYPISIQKAEEKLKSDKKAAEADGTATSKSKPVLMFKAKGE